MRVARLVFRFSFFSTAQNLRKTPTQPASRAGRQAGKQSDCDGVGDSDALPFFPFLRVFLCILRTPGRLPDCRQSRLQVSR
jgi:hypothetical protein